MKSKLAIVLLVTVLCCKKNYAQNETPQQLSYILKLEGNWVSNAAITMGDQTQKTIYYADFEKISDGSGLLMKEWCTIESAGKFTGTDLIGYDPNDGKIHWYTVDNMGTTHEHIGSFSDADHFTMQHKSMRDGKEFIENIVMTFTGKNSLHLEIIATLDGKQEEKIAGDFTRKSS